MAERQENQRNRNMSVELTKKISSPRQNEMDRTSYPRQSETDRTSYPRQSETDRTSVRRASNLADDVFEVASDGSVSPRIGRKFYEQKSSKGNNLRSGTSSPRFDYKELSATRASSPSVSESGDFWSVTSEASGHSSSRLSGSGRDTWKRAASQALDSRPSMRKVASEVMEMGLNIKCKTPILSWLYILFKGCFCLFVIEPLLL